jgi:hypothetical protein
MEHADNELTRKIAYAKAMLLYKMPDNFKDKLPTVGGYEYLGNEIARDWLRAAMDGLSYTYQIVSLTPYDFKGIIAKNKDGDPIVGVSFQCVVRLIVPDLGVDVGGVGSCSGIYVDKGNKKSFDAIDTLAKGAESDAFKRALRMIGPGNELYPDSDESQDQPQLPLMGIKILISLMGIKADDFFAKAAEIVGQPVTGELIGQDKKLAKKVHKVMKKYYLEEFNYDKSECTESTETTAKPRARKSSS